MTNHMIVLIHFCVSSVSRGLAMTLFPCLLLAQRWRGGPVLGVAVPTRNFLSISGKFVCNGSSTEYVFQEVSCLLLGLFEASPAATMQCRLQLRTVFLGAELRINLVLMYTVWFLSERNVPQLLETKWMASRITRSVSTFKDPVGYMIHKRDQDNIAAGWWMVSRSGHCTVVRRTVGWVTNWSSASA